MTTDSGKRKDSHFKEVNKDVPGLQCSGVCLKLSGPCYDTSQTGALEPVWLRGSWHWLCWTNKTLRSVPKKWDLKEPKGNKAGLDIKLGRHMHTQKNIIIIQPYPWTTWETAAALISITALIFSFASSINSGYVVYLVNRADFNLLESLKQKKQHKNLFYYSITFQLLYVKFPKQSSSKVIFVKTADFKLHLKIIDKSYCLCKSYKHVQKK